MNFEERLLLENTKMIDQLKLKAADVLRFYEKIVDLMIRAVQSEVFGKKFEIEEMVGIWAERNLDDADFLSLSGDCLRACMVESRRRMEDEGHGRIVTVAELAPQIEKFYDTGFDEGRRLIRWPCFSDHYRFAKNELNVVTGIPGSGKSEWTDALFLNLANEHSEKFAVFSPENRPYELHVSKWLEKMVGLPFHPGVHERMTRQQAAEYCAWLNQHFVMLAPHESNLSLQAILGLAEKAIKTHSITGLIIDPWNEIEHSRPAGQNESEYIGQCLMRCHRFTRANNIAIFIVAHPKKIQADNSEKEKPLATPYDIAGSAHWYNKADNCFSIYRKENCVEVHIQKIKFKIRGRVGRVDFSYDKVTGIYKELVTGGF